MNNDDLELNELLINEGRRRLSGQLKDGSTCSISPVVLGEELDESYKKDKRLANVIQWTTDDDRRFIPAARTCGAIETLQLMREQVSSEFDCGSMGFSKSKRQHTTTYDDDYIN